MKNSKDDKIKNTKIIVQKLFIKTPEDKKNY